MTPVKSYPVKLAAQGGMPTSLFDPRWKEPAIAARVAFTLYCRSDLSNARAPLVAVPPATATSGRRSDLTDARSFALVHVQDVEPAFGARRFKGGSFGELHRHYALGNGALNFHAQAVCFGIDDAGRFFLHATVGRFDGPWGNDAVLSASFFAGVEPIGAIVWNEALDPVGDKRASETGRDPRVHSRFDAIDRCELSFTARHGKDVPAASLKDEATKPKLSRARRSVVVKELARALALTDVDARQLQIAKLLAGVGSMEAHALVTEADPCADAAAITRRALIGSPT